MHKLVILALCFGIYSLNICKLKTFANYVPSEINNVNVSQYSDVYSNDLSHIEKFLFGKTYDKNPTLIRIARIETKLYGRSSAMAAIADRMNNIIRDYNRDKYFAKEECPYCSPKKGILQRIKDNFIGYPVGYTPQIEPSPYINTYGPSYMQGFYGSNGWRDHNAYTPSYAASQLHILD